MAAKEPEIIRDKDQMRNWSRSMRSQGKTIGLVPTMGYLHEGHLSLIRQARTHSDVIVVSIYVNPGQFSPSEDLSTYPSDFHGDIQKLKAVPGGVDVVFNPHNLYDYGTNTSTSVSDGEGAKPVSCVEEKGLGHETWVRVERLEKGMCGKSRPVFFRGVATVVTKLFNIVEPDVALLGKKDYQQWRIIQRMCAHVMAMAVQKLYPDAKVTIGPWIENGFYYDFDMEPLTDKELKRIKKEMDRIICRNLPLVREEVSREEAQRRISALNEPYKLEILDSIKEDPITIYHIGNEWWDLCAGPHVEYTGKINRKAVELESIAGAYWRGDEKKPMLQRIYGTAWENEEQLQAYLHFKEEAKRRDHRRLGQFLDLFSIQNDAGGGLVFWHPKGAIVRHVIEDLWKKTHIERGYDLLYTPHVAKADLWQISGHLDFYRENMYNQMDVEDELYQLRPMNCPYHILIYKRRRHSYNDFPIRVAELGTVYRYELSGSLHGLFRVRGFTQDDAHIFCLEDQIKDEIRGVLDLTEELLLKFGFSKYEVNLSTRPEKSVGDDDIWEKATSALRDALEDKGWSYQIDDGGGAFYGPKIDLKIEDALGRKWQCSTIQVDFNLPQRFDITYIDSNSEKKRPIMIHRAVLGSLERFFGVLIEHYAGDFPLWLSPVQAHVLPVTDTQLDYCKELTNKLKASGIRGELCHGERLPKLIRNSEMLKIPLMAVVGAKEVESGTVTVRSRSGDDPGTMSIDDFVSRIKSAIESRTSF